ncbi:MAG: hypothetical protein AAF439_06315 [Pseudomonadota bacterium]
MRAAFGPALAVLIACGIGVLLFDSMRLPAFFPWSGVVVPAVLTGLLAIGVGCVLPDGLHYTRIERMRLDLFNATGLTGASSERILGRITQATALASRLHDAAGQMQEETATVTVAAAEDLDILAQRLQQEPGRADAAANLISRAEIVVDAVESFVAYKTDAGAGEQDIAAARAKIMDSLTQMSDAADAVQTRLARQKLTDMEVAADVADGLFGRPER